MFSTKIDKCNSPLCIDLAKIRDMGLSGNFMIGLKLNTRKFFYTGAPPLRLAC